MCRCCRRRRRLRIVCVLCVCLAVLRRVEVKRVVIKNTFANYHLRFCAYPFSQAQDALTYFTSKAQACAPLNSRRLLLIIQFMCPSNISFRTFYPYQEELRRRGGIYSITIWLVCDMHMLMMMMMMTMVCLLDY